MKKYFHSDGKEKFGPFSFEELKNENITKDTLIWFEGLEDWKAAKDISEFEEIFKLIPPPINPERLDLHTENAQADSQTNDGNATSMNTDSGYFKRQGMFSKAFSFHGRIRRLEYGISTLFAVFLISSINVLIEDSYELAWLILFYIPLYWFWWAQGAKRCHDLGRSGWFQIIPLYVLWLLFGKGEEGIRNDYGINPRI